MEFFKKAAVFTDLHLGLKSNAKSHNDDCVDYVDWFIKTAKSENCETVIFCGDWNHNRNTINITTLNYGIECLEKLGKNFSQVVFFPGNHDLYYKDRRDMSSISFGKHIPGIQLITEPIIIDEVSFVPWLVGDEWKSIHKMKSRYMFAHLELPLFMMNAMVQMPDHGELRVETLEKQEYVFTGHFHKRQNRGNVHYIGNAFPHNYADAWDDDRGMMVFEWGGEPKYINWNSMPTYRVIKLSKLIDNMDEILKPKMHIRISMDIDISFEEANLIKEKIMNDYSVRECSLIPEKQTIQEGEVIEITNLESVDEIVTNQLMNIESDKFNKKTLLEIYSSL